MKKILAALMTLVMVVSLSVSSVHAQKKTAKTKSDSTAVHTKKDGTPDKRFKENKGGTTATPAGPTKKDGTADMRYKANKDAKKKS
ncbi:hypothetical protein GA0116948_116108 [Chitinophaga costaii]|uniref:Uncharacterized protein n=1 Tax=Chitinophaga costaii TaxID=1335309 RepID=A0A1C4FSF4_9BACT|nr:hypothetical protein [Chitinophaga costaii]PUZ20520.1 hypothetical protein DCM91_19000 [Chitinophaga costaii]SCC58949.1 hypothetical protein GA0116948_116108 [Chitinophaga costaii]